MLDFFHFFVHPLFFFWLGLLIGSFLNVVIYRLPVMWQKEWTQQALLELQSHPSYGSQVQSLPDEAPSRFNLAFPSSRCGHCHHSLAWYDNIPILSWLWLKGRCRYCSHPISKRYPLIELVNGLAWSFIAYFFPGDLHAWMWAFLWSWMLAASLIDWDTQLLPDDLTLPFLWMGLLASSLGWSGLSLQASVWGASLGYLLLWGMYWIFKLLTGKEGMGYGDFKWLAAIGSWLGPVLVLSVLYTSAALGCLYGAFLWLQLRKQPDYQGLPAFPFGPFLSMAALVVFVTRWSIF